ncbi:uncharacterized protein K02A2.6-like, partial [Crotalus tigris]|uniref:uncharacterized protein K02A2.6-like n=1 Tax=Crotalus tigris TaxID=88082 RepID=UPI00192F1C08
LDTGSALSIISLHTFRKICSSSGSKAKLRPSDIVLTDFQNSRVCVKGEATLNVQYKSFEGPLDLLVVGGERTSLIGLDWFEALGIHVTGLNSLQTLDLQEVCKEFADVFSPQLGTFKGPPVSLKLDPTVTPIRIKARRVPFALKSKIDTELDKLIQQGILEPVDSSPWETPIVTPLKANGDIRICADYKCTLNKALQQHAYPVPVVSHILASLKGGRVFAKLDLAQAYQQLPVDDDAAIAQTIVTHRGAFKVKRLQFGVNVAPGIFQSVMENTLRGIPGVCPYFDDVLIAGDSTHILAERLRAVLLRFRESGLKLRKDKCKIGVPSTEFLGFKIDAAGIHPAESKLTAILQAPRPKSKAELQAFLGLLNFYNSFLPHKASVAEPLHRLLDKQAVWLWSQAHEACFKEVKALLTSNSVLAHFNESLPVCIACDASPYGVGAVLSHLRSDGTQVPIAYYSRTLSSAERNYAQIDREALAVVAGIKKFHDFLYGRHFTVFTDHKPLLGLFTTRKQTPHIISPRMLRWSIFLSAYDFSLLHKPGKEMGHADGLSRLPLPVVEADPAPAVNILSIQALPELPLSARDVTAETGTDHTLSRVRSWVLSGWPEHCPSPEFQSFWSKRNELSLSQGCLLWGNRVVIPTSMRTRVLESLHEGHPGIVRMKALARSHLWWPALDKDIEATVWARNYGPGHTWVPASVSRITGPLSYEVALDNGRVLRRHIDQL